MDSIKVLVITDTVDEELNITIKNKYPDAVILTPDEPIKPCRCCFNCWIGTPGVCVLNDGYRHLGKELSECKKIIIISECFYGCFSPYIKNVIDRSIPYVLPLNKAKHKRSYKFMRYKNRFDCEVYLYGQNITDDEKNTSNSLCESNAFFWKCKSLKVRFFEKFEEIARCGL